MFNHARTLLMNLSSSKALRSVPGYELIPTDFSPLELSGALLSVRRRLFGSNPDQLMINFRTYQILSLLHSLPIADHLTALDPRLTYKLAGRPTLYDAFGVAVSNIGDSTANLVITDNGIDRSDISGVTTRNWVLTLSGTTTNYGALVFTDGISAPITLPGSNLTFQLNPNLGGTGKWTIAQTVRPVRTLAEIIPTTGGIDGATLSTLFQPTASIAEPYKTFLNLWEDHPETVYKLAGFLLAYIYRLNEIYRR